MFKSLTSRITALPLSVRFMLLATLAILVVSIGFFYFSLTRLSTAIQAQYLSRAEAIARTLADSSAYFVTIGDRTQLESFTRRLVSGDLLYAEISSTVPGLPITVSYPKVAPIPLGLSPSDSPVWRRTENGTEYLYPIYWAEAEAPSPEGVLMGPSAPTGQRARVGFVRLVFSGEPVRVALRREYPILFLLALLILGVGIILMRVLFLEFVQPVTRLTTAVQIFAQGRVPPVIQTRRSGEVKLLIEEFQKMTEILRRRENELREINRELAEANRVKSTFLASISHELKTPLHAIIGYTQLLLEGAEGPLTPAQIQDLQTVLGAGKHLLSLISQILEYARLEAGRETLSPEPFTLQDLLRECYEIFAPQVANKGIEFRLVLPEMGVRLLADPLKIRQIVLNLLSNALKFTVSGSIVLSAEVNDRLVRISVQDTGPGIPPESLPRVFEPFVVLDSELTRRHGGAGLGLAISSSYAQLHGGRLYANSEVGKGSVFILEIPFVTPVGEDEP